MSLRLRVLFCVPCLLVVFGCGDDETNTSGAGGSTTSSQASGATSSTGSEVGAKVTTVNAPTRTTIEITLDSIPTSAPEGANLYDIVSPNGPLEVEAVEVSAAGQRIVLTTEKQKLGVRYQLVIRSPGSELDLQGGMFLAADTAQFWTTDFSDFSEHEVTARRVGVGDKVVLYATDDVFPSDVDETISSFDNQILPTLEGLYEAAPDRDQNGRTVLLGLDGGGFYGGYFNPVDALTQAEADAWGLHSNEMEMLYVSVPDLGDAYDPQHVVTHEFSHLLYNEAHDFFAADWPYHNEGLAECAVHAVWGANATAAGYYLQAPSIQSGESLVLWEYSNYAQYVQAYVFWTYVASRLGGVSGYGQLFDLTGTPADMSTFFQAQLGQGFSDVQLDMLTATWLGDATGPYGFGGMLSFSGPPQTLGVASAPIELLSFEGVLFSGATSAITPTAAGPDVRFRAIASDGTVSETLPLDAAGGVIIALNGAELPMGTATQSSGNLTMSLQSVATSQLPSPRQHSAHDREWMHPPPLKPANRELLRAWRLRTAGF